MKYLKSVEASPSLLQLINSQEPGHLLSPASASSGTTLLPLVQLIAAMPSSTSTAEEGDGTCQTGRNGTYPKTSKPSGKFQLFLLARIVLKAISAYNGLFLAGYIATLNKEKDQNVLDWQLSPCS